MTRGTGVSERQWKINRLLAIGLLQLSAFLFLSTPIRKALFPSAAEWPVGLLFCNGLGLAVWVLGHSVEWQRVLANFCRWFRTSRAVRITLTGIAVYIGFGLLFSFVLAILSYFH
jgi:hypothetical protein